MLLNDFFETSGRLSDHFEHSPANCRLPNVGIVFNRGYCSGGCSARALIAWLVEIRLGHQN
ncbi:hypothetical protein BpHYR1_027012 [Brachionus plicatilis]|uniref:Uncharacterized protein n=1 Tax=Brachionus plicatilis TaxID=10195 RepID=A0A3M7SQ76_BRAPC|nr:hypothetical protein BpHYR1_027012 [Brachionus plicatilis]